MSKQSRSNVVPSLGTRIRGLSLIELMIALALGVVLILGLTQVFASVRASFGAADGMSRLQENARFAMQFIREDLRMAGHYGCTTHVNPTAQLALFNRLGGVPGLAVSPPPQPWVSRVHLDFFEPAADAGTTGASGPPPYVFQWHRPIEVYDFAGTSPGDVLAAPLQEFPVGVPAGAANQFFPPLPARLTSTAEVALTPNALLGNDRGDLVPGSDFFVVRYLRDHEPLLDFNGSRLPGAVSPGSWTLEGSQAAQFPAWSIWGLVRCGEGAVLMQVNDATPRRAPVGGLNQWDMVTPAPAWTVQTTPGLRAGDAAYRYEFAIYHVGRTGPDTPPALFRRRLLINPGNSADAANFGPAEELIPGVEMMQLVVGVDTEPEADVCQPGAAAPTPANLGARIAACTGDDTVDVFRSPREHFTPPVGSPALTAEQIFQRQLAIRSVRVSLLVRSPERLPATAAPAANTVMVGDVLVTPPADNRLRHVYDATISIRNRVKN